MLTALVLSANLGPRLLLLLLPLPLLQIVALQLLSTQLAEVLAAVHNAAGAMLQLCCSRCIVSCLVSQLIKVVSGKSACSPPAVVYQAPSSSTLQQGHPSAAIVLQMIKHSVFLVHAAACVDTAWFQTVPCCAMFCSSCWLWCQNPHCVPVTPCLISVQCCAALLQLGSIDAAVAEAASASGRAPALQQAVHAAVSQCLSAMSAALQQLGQHSTQLQKQKSTGSR
jgi:hypothetical protein